MQKPDLLLEIIIVDGCSTGGSHAVALELAEKYPGQVSVIRHEKNRGTGFLLEGYTQVDCAAHFSMRRGTHCHCSGRG
jgi:hypothetical protein